ncbi:MAG: hypothetical protein S0880_18455 [Actinomycetota bacterium]|nr:hypothetical protein [Actinomycetota bacterium]
MTTQPGDPSVAPLIFDDGSTASEFDSAPEVEAAFRTQRRIAIGYATLFAILTLAVPALSFVVPWWTDGRIIGGMSPAFVMAAIGLYVVFFALAVAAATLSSSVEEHMLGARPVADPLVIDGIDGIDGTVEGRVDEGEASERPAQLGEPDGVGAPSLLIVADDRPPDPVVLGAPVTVGDDIRPARR